MTQLPRVGLTLSGGGASGFGVMVGFASALDLLFLSHDLTDFESFGGVSAGSILGAYFGAGISPLDVLQSTFIRPNPTEILPFRRSDFYQPNLGELAATPGRIARAVARAAERLWSAAQEEDSAPAVLGILPSAILRLDRVGAVIRKNLEKRGANDFRTFPRRFTTVFYDLLRNERVVCGTGPGAVAELPVHEAVLASSTMPAIFAPRRVWANGRTMLGVDGGTAGLTMTTDGTDELDVLFAYNDAAYLEREDVAHMSAVSVLLLAVRLLFNQRNVEQVAAFMDRHPAKHVIPFESPPGASGNPVSWEAGLRAVRPAFERTKRELAERFDYLLLALEPRGARLNPEIADVSYEDALARGRALKTELRKRHGLVPA
jgi:predicted acylesterase/phospholipase RssA